MKKKNTIKNFNVPLRLVIGFQRMCYRYLVSGLEFIKAPLRRHQPCVICICSNIKLVGRRELQWSLLESLQHCLAVFGHVEL